MLDRENRKTPKVRRNLRCLKILSIKFILGATWDTHIHGKTHYYNSLVEIVNNQVVVSSRMVAERFGKRQSDVLRAIDNIKTQNCVMTSRISSMFCDSYYQVVVSSRMVAERFGKGHKIVLRSINELTLVQNCTYLFKKVELTDSYGRLQPAYLMNREGSSIYVPVTTLYI